MKHWMIGIAMGWSAAVCRADETVTLPKAEFEQMLESYQLVLADYVGPADRRKLMTGAIRGMMASLDPHSRYLDKDDLADADRLNTGRYVGIGVGVELMNGQILIGDVADNGPADRAGIRAGDSIVAIDGAPLFGLGDSQVARRMHGEPGSKVELTLARRGKIPLRTVTVTRATLQEHSVTVQRLAGDIVRIRIAEFASGTPAELIAALRQCDGPRRVNGIVLDLRNNPGGLVPAAVAVAGAFLPQDAVVFSATGRQPASVSEVKVSPRFFGGAGAADALDRLPAFAQTVPLVVLVNGASASAAELLAGALQDHGRAKVVGSRTYGKGSIQAVFPLSDEAAIKLTVARYFTPSGREVQEHGILPDVPVAPPVAEAGDDNVLFREADMANHLPASTAAPVDTPAQRPVAEDSKTFGSAGDRALRAALAQLHAVPSSAPAPRSQTESLAGLTWNSIAALFKPASR